MSITTEHHREIAAGLLEPRESRTEAAFDDWVEYGDWMDGLDDDEIAEIEHRLLLGDARKLRKMWEEQQ